MVRDGTRDFDFLFGSWAVHSRRLVARLEGSTEWEEFPGTCRTSPILRGLGNIDEFTLGIRGASHPQPLHLDDRRPRCVPLGAGALGRRRAHLETNWTMEFTRQP